MILCSIGEMICARSFQAAVGCVNAERGALGWTKAVGGTDGVAADEQFVFGADASDRITAWKQANGDVAWTSEKLLYRGLGAPLITGKMVVFTWDNNSQALVPRAIKPLMDITSPK